MPRHHVPDSFYARLVSTLALAEGFPSSSGATLGVTRLLEGTSEDFGFMDLAPLDDVEIPQNVDERLADTFASSTTQRIDSSTRKPRSRRSCNIAVHTALLHRSG